MLFKKVLTEGYFCHRVILSQWAFVEGGFCYRGFLSKGEVTLERKDGGLRKATSHDSKKMSLHTLFKIQRIEKKRFLTPGGGEVFQGLVSSV